MFLIADSYALLFSLEIIWVNDPAFRSMREIIGIIDIAKLDVNELTGKIVALGEKLVREQFLETPKLSRLMKLPAFIPYREESRSPDPVRSSE
jgi:hypothetical protein